MIAYLRGNVIDRNENSVILDVGGVGYEVFVPNNVMGALERSPKDAELYTYMQVKEDQTALYGFLSKQDLRTFKLLITVSGIGPKGALMIMSVMTTESLILAVLSDDVKTIAKTPGIGAKTAGKLVLELKDKFSLQDTLRGSDFVPAATAAQPKQDLDEAVKSEAVEALTALGYSPSEALKAVRSLEVEPGMTVEQVLKASLKYL